jgi:hypothetical protein
MYSNMVRRVVIDLFLIVVLILLAVYLNATNKNWADDSLQVEKHSDASIDASIDSYSKQNFVSVADDTQLMQSNKNEFSNVLTIPFADTEDFVLKNKEHTFIFQTYAPTV